MATNLPEYTVSELSFAVKGTIEGAYGLVRVRGEISGYKRHGSGHQYFCLKDDRAALDGVAWRNTLPKMAFTPEDGLEVVCTGRLTTFPGRSKYQLIVEHMAPAGIGALMAQLEERRRRLETEGLFAPERKRPLPMLPRVVGVVTSLTGAVIQDILHRLAERCPVHVLVWPVAVQGPEAAGQVAAAIAGFDALPAGGPVPRPEVLIVARGGGSIEDLWAFNEEAVVRAAAACSIPLISAVGHETDTTLIDHAADRRAPTPTAAAEMAVPVRADVLLRVTELGQRQEAILRRRLREQARSLEGLRRGLPDPVSLLRQAGQRLDDLDERLRLRTPKAVVQAQCAKLAHRVARIEELLRDRLRRDGRDLAQLARRIGPHQLEARLARGQQPLRALGQRLEGAGNAVLGGAGERLARGAGLLDSLGPLRVLARGYAIVRDAEAGGVLTTAAAARPVPALTVRFADGELKVHQDAGPPKVPPAARAPRRKPPEPAPAVSLQARLL